ncbi:Uncharacterised protein [Canicola haemoglobinophilus]|uniref:DNA pilot protein n=2 Tax=Canicola haemoglobinophilus TaxID=733 RepID=A0AB38H800_9PAST|nr:hypothetical protein [Canicola haemoglobinophilus]STO53825.1 Uncharacterised protein [Canicola haemoglobinophilus]STO68358.1 Uncharacterised protein [Canicola haemoglobinophilus]
MGFGGILASIANGLGGGMIKVADEGWKKEAEDRKYQFYADQKALDREFELTKMDKKHQYDVDLLRKKTAISQAVANAANNNPKTKEMDKFKDALDAIEGLNQGIAELDEKLANGNLSKEQKIALTQQRQGLLDQRTRIANNEKIWGKVKNGDYGEQLRATHAMKVGVFATPPKTETPQAAQTVMEVPRPKPKENKDYFSPYPTGYGLD